MKNHEIFENKEIANKEETCLDDFQMNKKNRINGLNIMNNISNMNNMNNIKDMNYMNNMNINNFDFNNENNMNNQLNLKKPNLIYPHKTGLQNLGHSSYMNSTIQCLSNIKELTNYLLKRYENFDKNIMPLTVEYSNLIYDLFNSKEKNIYLVGFNEAIKKLNFKKEGNPKDLISFIIEGIFNELSYNNTSNENENIKLKKDFNQQEIDSKIKMQCIIILLKKILQKIKKIKYLISFMELIILL